MNVSAPPQWFIDEARRQGTPEPVVPRPDTQTESGRPGCERGRLEDNWAHDYTDVEERTSAQIYLYCRQCGDVQRLVEGTP